MRNRYPFTLMKNARFREKWRIGAAKIGGLAWFLQFQPEKTSGVSPIVFDSCQ